MIYSNIYDILSTILYDLLYYDTWISEYNDNYRRDSFENSFCSFPFLTYLANNLKCLRLKVLLLAKPVCSTKTGEIAPSAARNWAKLVHNLLSLWTLFPPS